MTVLIFLFLSDTRYIKKLVWQRVQNICRNSEIICSSTTNICLFYKLFPYILYISVAELLEETFEQLSQIIANSNSGFLEKYRRGRNNRRALWDITVHEMSLESFKHQVSISCLIFFYVKVSEYIVCQ